MGQSTQQHIDALARAGIVTHVVTNPDGVDALFALSKAQDFPDVQFAATFDDGVIALGCPNGLPDALTNIATEVEVAEEPLPATAPTVPDSVEPNAALDARFDALSAQIDDMRQTALPAAHAQILNRLSAIEDLGMCRGQCGLPHVVDLRT